MIITYARSSSMGTHQICPLQYFFQYVLCWPTPTGHKALLGTCTHKALELLARRKLAEQKGELRVTDEECGADIPLAELTPDRAMELAWAHYRGKDGKVWTNSELRDCRAWMNTALEWGDGTFSPLKREIVAPEQFFDFAIDRPWADYEYELPNGDKLKGKFRVRGTMDLVVRVSKDTLEYIDWKTGRRLDWSKGTEKDYEALRKDQQLLLYYYALRHVFPEKNVLMTIFFLKDGGPFTLPFDDRDLDKAEEMLKKFFLTVKQDQRPSRIWPSQKCSYLCSFSKPDKTGSIPCEEINGQIVELGMDRVVAKHAKLSKLGQYGEGGGRSGK